MKIYCLFLNIVLACASSCIGQPSALQKAIESNDMSAVSAMIATGESPNSELTNGIVPLHIATSREMVELLLRSGAETENRSKVLKLTPLEFHSRKHWISTIDQSQNEVPKIVVNALIEGGARYTPTAAVYLGDVQYFEKLIAIDTSWVSSQIADKTLRLAVESGQRSIVWVLLDGGVDPNGKTETDGLPHIFYAVDNVDIARLLLEKGANVRRRIELRGGRSGTPMGDFTTVLHFACRIGCIETAKLFVQSGVDPNAQDSFGQTPLHVLAIFQQQAEEKNRYLAIAIFLIENDACIYLTDSDLKTAYEIAIEHDSTVELQSTLDSKTKKPAPHKVPEKIRKLPSR